MAGPARGALRSSARLSGGGGGAAAPAAREGGARSAEAAAAAARRRARAAERALEVEDSPRELRDKCRRLARALRNAKHLVVYTGAGISTAADIPDYRGPRGVWTRLQRGEAVGRVEVSRAKPTLTHMALTALWARGTLKFVVSQNCDGLHLRAGLPRRALAELHGDMFAERCAACRRVYLRAFDTTERTARHAHATRRLCHDCGAELADTIVHFGERGRAAWPLNWAGALRHAAAADVVLCLGSSLKVLRRYPRLWRMQCAPAARPELYIVNLQWTPKDSVAALKINARCDVVMKQVARRLRLRVPKYCARRDPLLAHAVPLAPPEAHTTRRPVLRAPPHEPAEPAPEPSTDGSASESPSASESDDELPLRRLAERIRAPAPPAVPSPAPPPLPPPPDLLHAFQVNMWSGDATILLRAHHAPSAADGAPIARRTLSDLRMFRIARRPPNGHAAVLTPGGSTAPRPPDWPAHRLPNGHTPTFPPVAIPARLPPNGHTSCLPVLPSQPPNWPLGARLRHLLLPGGAAPPDLSRVPPIHHLKTEPDIKRDGPTEANDARCRIAPGQSTDRPDGPKLEHDTKCERDAKYECDEDWDVKSSYCQKLECDVKVKRGEGSGAGGADGADRAASALAAAIIARAVLLCRASLYPGLHTILASRPRSPSPPRVLPKAECAWCARHYRSRRCQWYGAPPPDPLGGRVWRRVRARRVLCACCGERDAAPAAAAAAAADADADGGGWYGKGYRKGRRRTR